MITHVGHEIHAVATANTNRKSQKVPFLRARHIILAIICNHAKMLATCMLGQ